jgi:hypothetical protein
MKPAVKPQEDPEQLRARIEAFVRGCRAPAVFEPGEKIIPLEAGRYDLEIQGPSVVLHAWNVQASLVRRVVGIRDEDKRGKWLELEIRRLGQAEGSLKILDLERAGESARWQGDRREFRERFRRMLSRRFGDYEVRQISADPDLEHSLSPAYARALLARGQSAFAAVAVDDQADQPACDHILSFGLIWLDYLRAREPSRVVEDLKLFLPLKRSALTGNRLACLEGKFELYEFGPDGATARVDERNYGNLATTLAPAVAPVEPSPPASGWIERLCRRFGAECVARADGVISLRLRGLEFARGSGSVMTYGLAEDRPVTPASFGRVEKLAGDIAVARSADTLDHQHRYYRAAPERWLEALVRANVTAIDSALVPEPLYGQVPAVAGADRGIIDLLACDGAGRLAVIELKASEDIHLPLQGLDYWMRVKWHLDRGEFRKKGYFRGVDLAPAPPRLLLVSPVFDFHSTTETILRFFSPQMEVERVGLGVEWRKELKVVFRARGAERP